MSLRVVLVRSQIAANIGSTARVMRNFGVSELVLVAPETDPLAPAARQLSTHGEVLLHSARIVPDLATALADCVRVAATSAKIEGRIRSQAQGLPDEIIPQLITAMNSGPVALVFGPERDGLMTDEISRCTHLIHIPSDAGYPTLNLAQSVAICLYEARLAMLRTSGELPSGPSPIPFALQDRMFAALRESLERVGFLYDERADSLWHAVRQLIARAGPSEQEAKILLGLARQLRWLADRKTPDEV